MNYSTDNFVIDVGQYIPTIMFRAPYINGQPINHEQTYCIFAAIHDEIFNEIFPWGNISSSLEDALSKVYVGHDLFTVGRPRYWRFGNHGYELCSPGTITGNAIALKQGVGLPPSPPVGTIFQLPGGRVYVEWLSAFVTQTLFGIRNRLHDELLRFIGTTADYEWHFEYVTNGIFYTRVSKNPVVIQNPHQPEWLSEEEKVQQAIQELLSVSPQPQRTPAAFVVNVDIRPYSTDQLIQEVYRSAQQLLSQPASQNAQITFNVTYHVQTYFKQLQQFIRQFIKMNQLAISVSFTENWVSINEPTVKAAPLINDLKDITRDHDRLREIRTQIIRNNEVAQWQCQEITEIAPEIFNRTILPQDMGALLHATQWGVDRKGRQIDPLQLHPTVVGVIIAIDRYLEGGQLPAVSEKYAGQSQVLQEISWGGMR